MVSSGTVNGNASDVKSQISSYQKTIGEMAGNWKGPSYDNLSAKAEEFASEFSSQIESQMSTFATACDQYEEYHTDFENHKKALEKAENAERRYENAKNNNDPSAYSYKQEENEYRQQARQLEQKMEKLKASINESLQSASSITLEASAS